MLGDGAPRAQPRRGAADRARARVIADPRRRDPRRGHRRASTPAARAMWRRHSRRRLARPHGHRDRPPVAGGRFGRPDRGGRRTAASPRRAATPSCSTPAARTRACGGPGKAWRPSRRRLGAGAPGRFASAARRTCVYASSKIPEIRISDTRVISRTWAATSCREPRTGASMPRNAATPQSYKHRLAGYTYWSRRTFSDSPRIAPVVLIGGALHRKEDSGAASSRACSPSPTSSARTCQAGAAPTSYRPTSARTSRPKPSCGCSTTWASSAPTCSPARTAPPWLPARAGPPSGSPAWSSPGPWAAFPQRRAR